MRPSLVLLMMLLPVTGSAQTELGPFRFLNDSQAQVLTGGLIIGSGPLGLSVELPAPAKLKFLDFIPGYAAKLTVTGADGFVVEGAILSRVRYMPDRRIIGWVGLGISLGFDTKLPFIPLPILGVNYLYTDKIVFSVGAAGRGLMIGVGLHRGFGW